MASRVPDSFEDYGVVELCTWLKDEQKCDEDIIKIISDNDVTARVFLDLNDGDLKDLFSSFLQRKKIREILSELINPAEEPETPVKIRKIAPPLNSPPSSSSASLFMASPSRGSSTVAYSAIASPSRASSAVPYSAVLLQPQNFSASQVDSDRKRVIRLAMDSLIASSGEHRPTEVEVLNAGKNLATEYPMLRDNPAEPVRENYKNVVGQLRRRMYNVTPAQTNRGRKTLLPKEKARDLEQAEERKKTCHKEDESGSKKGEGSSTSLRDEREDRSASPIDGDQSSTSAGKKGDKECSGATGGDCSKFMAALEKVSASSKKSSQLIKLTLEGRRTELAKHSLKERLGFTLKKYPLFTKSHNVIVNMAIQLPGNQNLEAMEGDLMRLCRKVVIVAAEKQMLKMSLSSLSKNSQMMAAGIMHMPLVCRGKGGAGKLDLAKSFIHILKKEELWKAAVAEHERTDGFYIVQNRVGDEMTIIIMHKTDVIMQCESVSVGVLSMIGLHYLLDMPYPTHLNGCLLLVQKEVLKDNVHIDDMLTLERAQKALNMHESEESDYNI